MRSLLDINFIIAILDPDHIFQNRAHQWWSINLENGWASCPLTENGVVRIMSNPGYRQKMRFTPNDVIAKLREFVHRSDHEFWADAISLLDETIFLSDHIHTPKQITDLYLLALAIKHNGRLVTFDEGIALSAVTGARPEHVCMA